MNWNGIVIMSTEQTTLFTNTRYRGLCYGEPWPLAKYKQVRQNKEDNITKLNDIIQELTTAYIFNDGTYAPAVVVDLDVLSNYVQQCNISKIQTRILLCATPRPWPVLDDDTAQSLVERATFVGFDYAYSSCDFSAVFSDLNPPPSPELEMLSAILNQNGIFSTSEDMGKYITARWDLIKKSGHKMSLVDGINVIETPLEGSGDFVPFEIYELDTL